uniref:RIMS-binding protein 2 n=1 Tax=Malurus cyaneus samueli TaxID=2593467 RepID=A0A8C5TGC3_9PASS
MRNVAERRQQLEVEHKEALLVLQEKQEEVRRLQQAQAEARREHEGAVQLLEFVPHLVLSWQARVKDLEDQCRSQTEQFSLLSQELQQFRLQTGKIDLLTSTLVTSELPLALCSSTPQPHWEKGNCWTCLRSPKSCPTPEVSMGLPSAACAFQPEGSKCITESTSKSSNCEYFSYNPFDGPNENPEAELPLTAGEYIYIYGDMDEDGFFEGELMDGRRGLVPSNFVERVSDDDLMTFLPPELNDLTHSSYQEKSLVSASTSSGDKSEFSIEESSISPLASRAEGDQEEPVSHTAVPYPRKLTLIKQLARSIVVGWEPPLLPSGCPDIQSYNIYVDEELRQNVKSGLQTKAVIEKLDLHSRAYRVSVQTVTEHGSSDKLRCTFFVGQDFGMAPTMLKVRNVTATSAEVTWLPCNSNYSHGVYLNGQECDVTKPGVYWYTFRNLQPSTQYVAKLEARPMKTPWEEVPEGQEQDSAVIHFTTPLAGTPDAPLDVQVEAGPSPGILVISWLPVTIDAEGSSNGVRVTGYAVYADGQKVIEVTSPTAGSVLVDLSQLQMFQVCREVSVRTMSQYGESVDSVPAQISSVLLQSCHCTSPVCTQTLPEKASSPSRLSAPSASLGQALGTSSQGSDTVGDKKCLSVPPQQAGMVLPGQSMEPSPSRELGLQQPSDGTEMQVSSYISCPVPSVQERGMDRFGEWNKMPLSIFSVTYCCLWAIIQWWQTGADVLSAVSPPCTGPPRSSAPESSAKDDGIRIFVALFDYDPVSMSPNPDAAEEELPFKEGQILKVCGDKDADGFYRGECAGREGYIPCNMVSEVPVESSELKQQLLKQGFLPADTENIEAELLTPRRMVAAFDYNPKESSPNTDVEAELTFSAGDVITVFGSMDDDGFYYVSAEPGKVLGCEVSHLDPSPGEHPWFSHSSCRAE